MEKSELAVKEAVEISKNPKVLITIAKSCGVGALLACAGFGAYCIAARLIDIGKKAVTKKKAANEMEAICSNLDIENEYPIDNK